MCAFPPIAVEFVSRNVHLVIAVLLVLGLRRWGGWFSVGAAIKLAPVLGIPYLALRGRVRDAVVATLFGAALLVVSVALAPDLWRQFIDILQAARPGRRVRVPARALRGAVRRRGGADRRRGADRATDRRAAARGRGDHRPADAVAHRAGDPGRRRPPGPDPARRHAPPAPTMVPAT